MSSTTSASISRMLWAEPMYVPATQRKTTERNKASEKLAPRDPKLRDSDLEDLPEFRYMNGCPGRGLL